jgi:DNA-binding transcriptional ArsR family regulator
MELMKLLYHPERTNISIPGILYALGDPIRLEIVKRLAIEGEQTCVGLELPIAKSTLSYHLKVLREAGVIYCRKEGTQQINSLRREDLDALFPSLLDTVLQVSESFEPTFSKPLDEANSGCNLEISTQSKKGLYSHAPS